MSRYESQVKVVNALQQSVYNRLSDLSGFQAMKEAMPAEIKQQIKAQLAEQAGGKVTVSNFRFTTDEVIVELNGSDSRICIVERQDPKLVKYKPAGSPIDFTLWVQMLPEGPYQTKIRVTVEVDIPFFLKPMIGKKLDGVADNIADMICRIPF